METFLAILMVLGIYLGAPLVVGFAITGVIVFGSRRSTRARRAQPSVEEQITAMEDLIAEARSDRVTEPATRRTSPRAVSKKA